MIRLFRIPSTLNKSSMITTLASALQQHTRRMDSTMARPRRLIVTILLAGLPFTISDGSLFHATIGGGINITESPSSPLLGPCEMGCETFQDCEVGLSCVKRQNVTKEPLGCPLEGIPLGESYCSQPIGDAQPDYYTQDTLGKPTINYVGQLSSAPEKFPLGLCEGDCDGDGSCQFGLACYRRGPNQPVPGCLGNDAGKRDYCYKPPPGSLVLVGNGGKPSHRFPLGMCQGDCDGDKQCQLGLVCHLRDDVEKVQKCNGRGSPGDDYCSLPLPGQLVLQGVGGRPGKRYPLKKCQGSCSSDSDCDVGLVCFRRRKKQPIPGCFGDGISNTNYCYAPPPGNLVVMARDAKKPKSAIPLGRCEGECTSDRHCQIGFSCSERQGIEKVPGCSGRGISGKNYCHRPPDGHFVITAKPGQGRGHLQQCQGECISHGDCARGLLCMTKTGKGKHPICKGRGVAGRRYCFPPQNLPTPPAKNELAKTGSAPFDKCRGHCNSDSDCKVGLSCRRRQNYEFVPGCKSSGERGVNYCYDPPPGVLVVKAMRRKPQSAFPLGNCQGSCENDVQCQFGLSCFLRSGNQPVPGCSGSGVTGAGYCYKPPPGSLVLRTRNGNPKSNFPLGECQGECRSDKDCHLGLQCMKRSGNERVLGCKGKGATGRSYCYKPFFTGGPPKQNVLRVRKCSPSSPCQQCEGNCQGKRNNCAKGHACVPRKGKEAIPGCTNGGSGDVSGVSYCSRVTYVPGDATHVENGLLLSTGLKSRVIAEWKKKVEYANGQFSKLPFHEDPDGAAIYEDKKTGGWIYVSNSEASKGGGVGALTFNANGDVVDYSWLLGDTKRNCGGGKTWYKTWLSCEEVEDGHVWEVDPWNKEKPRRTLIGTRQGDMYEAAAYDNRNKRKPKFYITTDRFDGPVVKYSPDDKAVSRALITNDYRDLLHTNQTGTAKNEYLLLKPNSKNPAVGTFQWTDNIRIGEKNAFANYNNCEGIDIRNGMVYFTCKKRRHLFILDLDRGTYRRSSTSSGAFDNGPDQVARILGDGDMHDILYFCEEGGKVCGVHGRDRYGNFYTILESAGEFKDETSGLAFSPDNKRMYLSFQEPGLIFEITRKDGHKFGGARLDIKYHADQEFKLP